MHKSLHFHKQLYYNYNLNMPNVHKPKQLRQTQTNQKK